MGLSEYYNQQQKYSQGMYIIFTALSKLPASEKKKTRASLQIMMGNILLEFFKYNSNLIRVANLDEKPDKEIEELTQYINTKDLVFENSDVIFPSNKVYKNKAEITELFKMAMTQYKKALEIYELDGFVTEHCNIVKRMSELYKVMADLEDDFNRIYAMGLKRSQLIKPLFDEISPKHFIGLWRVNLPFS